MISPNGGRSTDCGPQLALHTGVATIHAVYGLYELEIGRFGLFWRELPKAPRTRRARPRSLAVRRGYVP